MPRTFNLRQHLLTFFLLVCLPISVFSNSLIKDGKLDTPAVSKLYMDGELEELRQALEEFREAYPKAEFEDRVTTYKYLSIIYAANPDTKAKAEAYMYKLLDMVPTIQLIDLYISDNIQAVFNRVRERFEAEKNYETNYDKFGRPKQQTHPNDPIEAKGDSPDTKKKNETSVKGSKHWIYWTAGLGIVAATVIGYVLWSNGSDEPTPEQL